MKEMKFLFIIIYLFFVVAGSGVGKIGKASAVTVKVYSVSLAVDFLSRKVSLKRCCILFVVIHRAYCAAPKQSDSIGAWRNGRELH